MDLIRNPQLAGQSRWTAKKFYSHFTDELSVEIGYIMVVRWFHERGFARKVPRFWPDRQDEKSREAFVQQHKVYPADPEIDL
ncbi:MAG: winged helix-turn-helix domain-containing protein [Proteobacteria bacterium]|nr:winged helix-turn-helix domain-containing protein [Pseudomonadota bacterium]